MNIKKNTILNGNCIEMMKTISDENIDCIITSPPYWGLRDYGVEGQIGLEPTLEAYHTHLLEVTAECKRVLKKTGTMFWVHGDSYGGSWQNYGSRKGGQREKSTESFDRKGNPTFSYPPSVRMPPKCLTMQNYRLAERMVDEQGWILRNILIWHKKNHMPSSVQDRYANAYEPVFFFSKSKKYWFDLDSVRVPHTSLNNPPGNLHKELFEDDHYKGPRKTESFHIAGKNPGDVFSLSTQPFPEAHFAVFPEKLIEPFVKAGCPVEVCTHCGFIKERITEKFNFGREETSSKYGFKTTAGSLATKRQAYRKMGFESPPVPKTIGRTSCTCKDENKYDPGIVLDPFMGAGTTAVVAKKLGRNYLGIELNQEYIKIARKRISAIPANLSRF